MTRDGYVARVHRQARKTPLRSISAKGAPGVLSQCAWQTTFCALSEATYQCIEVRNWRTGQRDTRLSMDAWRGVTIFSDKRLPYTAGQIYQPFTKEAREAMGLYQSQHQQMQQNNQPTTRHQQMQQNNQPTTSYQQMQQQNNQPTTSASHHHLLRHYEAVDTAYICNKAHTHPHTPLSLSVFPSFAHATGEEVKMRGVGSDTVTHGACAFDLEAGLCMDGSLMSIPDVTGDAQMPHMVEVVFM
eukprot:2680778-Amphidinium_carterae.1